MMGRGVRESCALVAATTFVRPCIQQWIRNGTFALVNLSAFTIVNLSFCALLENRTYSAESLSFSKKTDATCRSHAGS
jgi:hypothetical protein